MKLKATIFYIDSDIKYAEKCLSYLIQNGYNVKLITSVKNALIEYSYAKPNLIIFDEKLKDGKGLNFIKKLQNFNIDFKTILFTEDNTQDILIEALSLKIDKFVKKENSFNTLINEINSLNLIKEEEVNNNATALIYDLGKNFIYEEDTYKILNNQKIIQLTTQESELINNLIKANGKFVSQKNLLSLIGTNGETSIDTLRTVIRNIRKKTYRDIIKNQSGIGYKINISVDIDIFSQEKIKNDTKLNIKILLLKGNQKRNELLSYKLSKFGFQCESACTIRDATAILEHETFEYIILELDLPDGDGIDLIRHLDNSIKTKLIILSNPTDIHYKEYLYFKGILDYIVNVNDLQHLAYSLYKTIYQVETNTKKNNILVIEQSKRVCEQIKDLLLPRNYNIDILSDITNAYEIIKTNEYNLILLDIAYKKSYELISNVKYNINSALPFIVLTDANRSDKTVREAYKNDANECLRKPLFAEEFILKVDQLIEQSKLVSELKEQKELMESYQEIVDKTTILSKTDVSGTITYVNNIFCKISGYAKEELIGKPHNIIRHPDMPSSAFKEMWETIKNEKKIWSGIVKNRTKDGNDYIVHTYIVPILDTDNEIVEFIALRNDITNIYQENA